MKNFPGCTTTVELTIVGEGNVQNMPNCNHIGQFCREIAPPAPYSLSLPWVHINH